VRNLNGVVKPTVARQVLLFRPNLWTTSPSSCSLYNRLLLLRLVISRLEAGQDVHSGLVLASWLSCVFAQAKLACWLRRHFRHTGSAVMSSVLSWFSLVVRCMVFIGRNGDDNLLVFFVFCSYSLFLSLLCVFFLLLTMTQRRHENYRRSERERQRQTEMEKWRERNKKMIHLHSKTQHQNSHHTHPKTYTQIQRKVYSPIIWKEKTKEKKSTTRRQNNIRIDKLTSRSLTVACLFDSIFPLDDNKAIMQILGY
jgi:hypothetical protein